MAIDPRFLVAHAREVFNGNELLVKGCLEVEGGVHLLTGYPGSPVAGFFDILGDLKDLLKPKGVRAFQANNEALAAASVNGSQMLPMRAVCTMKSVGVHVASDALALGNLAGAHAEGGAVVIMGEDPWCDSTQVPADSRFLCEHLRMPVVEPGGPQETKDWINLSFKLSRAAGLYIGYIVTTAQADGGGTVYCHPNQFPEINTNQRVALETPRIDLSKLLLPPRTWQEELKIPARFEATMKAAREVGINRIEGAGGFGVQGSGFREEGADRSQESGVREEKASGEAAEVAPLGFIVTGMAGPYLRHVLHDVGLSGRFPILHMGMSYPADVELVREFSKLCRTMIVIEERRSFLEKNIRDSLFHRLPHEEAADISRRLFGKSFPASLASSEPRTLNPEPSPETTEGFPETRGLNYSVVAQKLIPLLKRTEEIPAALRNGRLSGVLSALSAASRPRLDVLSGKLASRTPTFCPGCPHRDSSAVLLEIRRNLMDAGYMKKVHRRGPVDLVAHGDTGCYTMLMFAPTEQLMHNYSGMGLGGGTGSGIDPFIKNKQIVFLGDGTFFHSGVIGISNAIKAGQDITYIILENGTTAMTGHQEHAGLDEDILGNAHHVQDIEAVVRGLAGRAPIRIVKLSPADRDDYKKVLEETILADGVKVIIADKECGITHHRTKAKEERKVVKEKGYLPSKTHMNVTPEVCENCLECTKQTACPGLTTLETDYGPKIDTDLTWCVNDGACERVRTSNDYGTSVKPCPSFEQVTVLRSRRRRYTLPNLSLDKLPEPQVVHDMAAAHSTWRVHMSGVGGMGIGIVGAILVRAGHKQGYRVIFQDKKGLAIRNGGVFAQITFVAEGSGQKDEGGRMKDEKEVSSVHPSSFILHPSPRDCLVTGSIPYGGADLLLGIDVLEAARAIDPREPFRIANKQRTCAVLNLHKQPTVFTLLGKDDFDPEKLRDDIFAHVRPEHSYANNLAEICERRLGSKQFVNILMLGVAYQLGLVPVSAHAIAWAIKDTIRRDHRKNLKAFNIGRKLALEPRVLPNKPQPETWDQLVTNKARILRRTRLMGGRIANHFERLTQTAIEQMRHLPEATKYDLALRIYDVLQYQDAALAKRYVERVRGVYQRDSAARKYAATGAAVWNLAKVVLIKDEPYVSYLLTRYEKRQRDVAKYNVDVANGDKLVYRHHTSPEFNVFGKRVRLKITTRDWMLHAVRHCKWWRKLPGWHVRETAFRDWYVGLLERADLSGEESYARALRILRCPEAVTGYREVRYPKMDRARELVEAELGTRPPEPEERAGVMAEALGTPSHV